MNITDLSGNAPCTALAPFAQATYSLLNLPNGPGSILWTLTGDLSSLLITGTNNTAQLTLISQQRSQQPGATMLTATFTPQGQGTPAVASIALTVFELVLALAPPVADDTSGSTGSESSCIGVGETRVLSACTLPAGVVPAQAGDWQWSVGADLQIMGDASGPVVSLVANSASNNAEVTVALAFAGGNWRASRQLSPLAVQIMGAQGGLPISSIPVGQTAGFAAAVQPSADDAQVFWTGGANVSLAAQDTTVTAQGVQPSAVEGADGLAVTVLTGGAQAHALIPLTVYATAITGAGGAPAPTQLQANGRQRYAVSTSPPLSDISVSWSVQGPAALTGSTTQRDVELITTGPSESAGDVVLSVSVLPPGMPHDQPTAVLRITSGTPRR